jgi:hypothetical protein
MLTYDQDVIPAADEASPTRLPGMPRRHSFGRRRSLRLVALGVLVAAAIGSGVAAAKQWLLGQPAPPPVVADFNAYTTQLGFHPNAGKAFFAAEDGVYKLYATSNREGTYCVVVDEPWKHANAGDGGTCVAKRDAGFPITAGVVGASSRVQVVAGRVTVDGARSVRFTDSTGASIERQLGAGGFYIAGVHSAAGCPSNDWNPTLVAVDGEGRELARSRIVLETVDRFGCGWASAPHGPYAARG